MMFWQWCCKFSGSWRHLPDHNRQTIAQNGQMAVKCHKSDKKHGKFGAYKKKVSNFAL
jgi:hypothetical protein